MMQSVKELICFLDDNRLELENILDRCLAENPLESNDKNVKGVSSSVKSLAMISICARKH